MMQHTLMSERGDPIWLDTNWNSLSGALRMQGYPRRRSPPHAQGKSMRRHAVKRAVRAPARPSIVPATGHVVPCSRQSPAS